MKKGADLIIGLSKKESFKKVIIKYFELLDFLYWVLWGIFYEKVNLNIPWEKIDSQVERMILENLKDFVKINTKRGSKEFLTKCELELRAKYCI